MITADIQCFFGCVAGRMSDVFEGSEMKAISLDAERLAKAASRPIDEIKAVVVTEAMTSAAEAYWEVHGKLRSDVWSCLDKSDFEEFYRIMHVLRPREHGAVQVLHPLPSP